MHISCGRKVYFHANYMTQPLVCLVIADVLEGLPIPRMCDHDHEIPPWSAKNVDSVQSIFSFYKKYLHNDGAILVFQPLESRRLLMSYLKSICLEVIFFQTCYNGIMLTRPILPSQKIIYSLSHLQLYFSSIISISYHT